MVKTSYSLLVSALAGFSTVIGAFIIFFRVKNKDAIILKSLSFAAGVMVCISLFDLIPNSYAYFHKTYFSIYSLLLLFCFVIVGIICAILIDRMFPSVENKLLKTGFISMIALMFHNIPEGIATFVTTQANFSFGLSLAFAISMHNIPEGISIAVPIYYSTNSKKKALFYTVIAGFSEFVGAILSCLFLSSYMSSFTFGVLYAMIAGIMMYLSFYELLPEAFSYHKKSDVFLYFGIGFCFMILSHFLF